MADANLILGIGLSFVVLAMAAIIIAAIRVEEARVESWRKVAARLNLCFAPERLEGTLHGLELLVSIERRRVDGLGTTGTREFTRFAVCLGLEVPDGLRINPETWKDKIRKVAGPPDIELGLPHIDDNLLIEGRDADSLRAWATDPHVVRGLQELTELDVALFAVERGWLKVEVRYSVESGERLENYIHQAISIGLGLCGRASPAELRTATPEPAHSHASLPDGHW